MSDSKLCKNREIRQKQWKEGMKYAKEKENKGTERMRE
jgi:hypothetical protein